MAASAFNLGRGKLKLADKQDIKDTVGGNGTKTLAYTPPYSGFLVVIADGESARHSGINLNHNGDPVEADRVYNLSEDVNTHSSNYYGFYVKAGDEIKVSYTNASGYSNRHLLLMARLYK